MKNICEILNNIKSNFYVKLYGWIRYKRYLKNFIFLTIFDGSSIEDIQIIISEKISNFEEIKKITIGSSIKVYGFLVNSLNENQKKELYVFNIKIIGLLENVSTYPILSKNISFDFLRKHAHLRPRTKIFSAINRIRNNLYNIINNFLYLNKYIWISTPILTSFLPEEDVELFDIINNKDKKFFKQKTSLTISSQLALEAFACSMKKVYSFSPVFRAENSDTNRHLAEFWMLELEDAFINLYQMINFLKKFLKDILIKILFLSLNDIKFLEKKNNINIISRILYFINKNFLCISYKKAIDILINSKKKFNKPVVFGMNLTFEHETYLTEEYFKQAVAITLFPQRYKAFYMKCVEYHYTLSVDIIFPFVGELIGGSEREDNYICIKNKLFVKQIDSKKYSWYLDLRKYGTVFHSGFGLGFERILMFVTGIQNIRDVIPFPRTKGNINF